MILNAKAPEPLAEYEDIYSDIEKGRWVFIKESRKLYWDRQNEQIENADTLNLLYKRDPELRVLPVRFFHENNIFLRFFSLSLRGQFLCGNNLYRFCDLRFRRH